MEKYKATPIAISEEQLQEKIRHLIGSPDGPQYGAVFLLGVRMAMVVDGRPLDKKFTQAQVKVILDGVVLVCMSIYKNIGDDVAAEMLKNHDGEAAN